MTVPTIEELIEQSPKLATGDVMGPAPVPVSIVQAMALLVVAEQVSELTDEARGIRKALRGIACA